MTPVYWQVTEASVGSWFGGCLWHSMAYLSNGFLLMDVCPHSVCRNKFIIKHCAQDFCCWRRASTTLQAESWYSWSLLLLLMLPLLLFVCCRCRYWLLTVDSDSDFVVVVVVVVVAVVGQPFTRSDIGWPQFSWNSDQCAHLNCTLNSLSSQWPYETSKPFAVERWLLPAGLRGPIHTHLTIKRSIFQFLQLIFEVQWAN